jgi:hypothetical protein
LKPRPQLLDRERIHLLDDDPFARAAGKAPLLRELNDVALEARKASESTRREAFVGALVPTDAHLEG